MEAVFPLARVVVDSFHVIADSNKRMDEAGRIEQDVYRKRRVQIPKKIFLIGREKLTDEKKQKVDKLLDRYPGLKGFYWAKEKIRELYRQGSREEATRTLDKIIFKIFHGSPREEMFRRFKEGELEDSPIPFKEVEEVVHFKKYPFLQKPILSLRFFGLNTQIDLLRKEKIRKAINFAVPKEEIGRDILKGMSLLTDRIIPLGMPGYKPSQVSFGYQPQKAKELLREAGYPEGKGIPPIELWSSAQSDLAVKELEMLKFRLSQVGIPINIHYETNYPKFLSMLRDKKASIFMRAWYADFPDPDNFLGILFHSKSKYNYLDYHNPEVDRLLDRAKAERDYLKRMEMYRKIEGILLEDAPIIPMVNHLFQMAYQPYVRGIEMNALGGPYIPMKKIWLEK